MIKVKRKREERVRENPMGEHEKGDWRRRTGIAWGRETNKKYKSQFKETPCHLLKMFVRMITFPSHLNFIISICHIKFSPVNLLSNLTQGFFSYFSNIKDKCTFETRNQIRNQINTILKLR